MTFKSLLPNKKELEYACYIAFAITLAFLWLEWSIERHAAIMTVSDHCAEYSGINEDNSPARMEIYYSCLKGE